MTDHTFEIGQRVVFTDPQTKQQHPGVIERHDPNRQAAHPEREWGVLFDAPLWPSHDATFPAFCAAQDLHPSHHDSLCPGAIRNLNSLTGTRPPAGECRCGLIARVRADEAIMAANRICFVEIVGTGEVAEDKWIRRNDAILEAGCGEDENFLRKFGIEPHEPMTREP